MSDAVVVALITAVPSTMAAFVSLLALLRLGVVTKKVEVVATKVEEVHHATNSMKDDLVAATQLAGEAKGRDDQRAADQAREVI